MTAGVLDGDKRAALLRAARGQRPSTGPVAQGIRVIATPAAQTSAATVPAPAPPTAKTTAKTTASKPPTAEPTTGPAAAMTAAEPTAEQPATKPAVAEPPAAAVADGGIERLLAAAEACTSPRVQGLASRVRELVAELQGRLATAARELEAEQQVVLLRVQLAEAEQRLRTLRWGDTSPAAARPATSSTASKEEMRAARQWALANGVECSTTGRIPARVIEAWRAATAAGTAEGGVR